MEDGNGATEDNIEAPQEPTRQENDEDGETRKDSTTNKQTPGDTTTTSPLGDSGYWENKRLRLGVLCGIMFFFCLLAFDLWFNAAKYQGNGLQQGFGFEAAGLFFIFISLIATFAIIFLNKENRFVDLIIVAVYIGGAVLYFIGGCIIAGWYNSKSGLPKKDATAAAAIYFGEALIISFYACLIALDYFRNICGPKGRRIFIHLVLLGFGALILFFGYATPDVFYTKEKNSFHCIAAGYFFILIAMGFYMGLTICCKNMAIVIVKLSLIETTIACTLVWGGFLTCVGYWALAAADFDKRAKAYYVAYGFFILFVSFYIGLDIKLGDFVPKRK